MTLTIIDSKSHEPLLVLSEDDKGLSVAGGDPKYVKVLGLDRFSNLKEIADHINSAGSDVQALFEDGEDATEPEQANPDMDDRIKPALDMIRALMTKVNDRKKREKQEEDQKTPEHKLENTSESEIMMNPLEQVYVSVDGDNIGNAVARAEEEDDEEALAHISGRINAGQDVMRDWAIRMGGYVIEQGGDEGVMKVPATAVKEIENLRSLYAQAVGATASVGVGRKISESTKARMLAKLKGKNRTVIYDASTPQELELRLQDKDDTESNKLRTAMRNEQSMNENHPENPRQIQQDTSKAAPVQAEQEQQPQQEQPSQQYSGSKLKDAKAFQVQQEKKAPKEPEKKTQKDVVEGKALGGIDNDLVKSMQSDKTKPTGSKNGDPNIDDRDLSDAEDPEFVKNFMYMIKHGGRNK